jgi:transcriptional regulator with XRE-family HTH domain
MYRGDLIMHKPRIDTCANRIAEALLKRGMKQTDLCNLADIPKSSLSLYMRGAYDPKQDRIYKMAKVLNVSEAWLMGYDVPMERQSPTPVKEQTLTEAEEALIELFRLVPEEQQKLVLQMIRAALGRTE